LDFCYPCQKGPLKFFWIDQPKYSPKGVVRALAMTGADVAQSELGLHRRGHQGRRHGHRHRLRPPRPGRLLRPRLPRGLRLGLRRRRLQRRPDLAELQPGPVPDPDPDDCNGHGTHVAGIVGANGDVVGVAPEVTFGAYRVFGCEGSTTADIMIAAMERALADGMDVLNMSIGSAFQWPQYPTAVAPATWSTGHGRGGLDRQQRRQRPLLGRRARPRRQGHRRGLVRQQHVALPRSPSTRRPSGRLRPAGCAACRRPRDLPDERGRRPPSDGLQRRCPLLGRS
jgi:hypothetical protein